MPKTQLAVKYRAIEGDYSRTYGLGIKKMKVPIITMFPMVRAGMVLSSLDVRVFRSSINV